MPKDSSILIFFLISFILSSYLAYICYPKYDPKTAVFAGNLSYDLTQTIQRFALLVIEFVTLNILGYGYAETSRSIYGKIIDGATKELDHKSHNITVRELSFSDNANYQVIQAIPNEFLQTSKPRPTLFYFHGGGMLFGKPHLMTIATAINLRVQVFGVKYRLAPEHKFPAGLDDCSDAIRRILRDYPNKFNVGKFGLFGVSAGGYLAIATGMDIDFENDPLIAAAGRKKKNLPNKPEIIMPVVPMTQALRFDLPSYTDEIKSFPPFRANMIKYWLAYAFGNNSQHNFYNQAANKILARNWHWSENILNDHEFQSRVDPEKWIFDDKEQKNFKKYQSNSARKQSYFKHKNKINKYGYGNPLPNDFEKLLKNKLYNPGLASEKDLSNFLNNTKKVVIVTSGHDPLNSDGVIFFSRLKNAKIGKEMHLSLNNLILEDIEGATHTTLFDSTLIKPKQGYEFADPYARKVFDYLEDVKT